MTMQINISDVWKDVDCEGSKINIAGVWKDFDCEDELGGGVGAVQVRTGGGGGDWNPTTQGGSGWGGSEDCCDTSSGILLNDAATSDAIAPGGSIPITMVSGMGCPPYNWSVSNVGYSLEYATTSGDNAHKNTLYSVGGTCGEHYEAMAQIGVSDTCGSGVVIDIRNSGGYWDTCNGCSTTSCSTTPYEYHYFSKGCRIRYRCGDSNNPPYWTCGMDGCGGPGVWTNECPGPCEGLGIGGPPWGPFERELMDCGTDGAECRGGHDCLKAVRLSFWTCP